MCIIIAFVGILSSINLMGIKYKKLNLFSTDTCYHAKLRKHLIIADIDISFYLLLS